MQTDWMYGLIGGLIIGVAGAIYLLVNGRIMGASGIIGELVDGTAGSTKSEKLSFLAGLLLAPGIAAWFMGGVETKLTQNLPVVVVAGLFVGVGTRIARGCTSGHGVCGISRLSLRGIVATVFYILAGGLIIVFTDHLLGIL